jgi:hypothetical protein
MNFGEVDYFSDNIDNVHLCIGTGHYKKSNIDINYRNTFEITYILNLTIRKIIKIGEKHIIYLIDSSYRDRDNFSFNLYLENVLAEFKKNILYRNATIVDNCIILNSYITISYQKYNIVTNHYISGFMDSFEYSKKCLVDSTTLNWALFFSSLSRFLLKQDTKLFIHNEAYNFNMIGLPDNYYFEFFCELGYILDYFSSSKIFLYLCPDQLAEKLNTLPYLEIKNCYYVDWNTYKSLKTN